MTRATLGLSCLLIAGCGAGGQPSPPPAPTVTVTASPSAAPSPAAVSVDSFTETCRALFTDVDGPAPALAAVDIAAAMGSDPTGASVDPVEVDGVIADLLWIGQTADPQIERNIEATVAPLQALATTFRTGQNTTLQLGDVATSGVTMLTICAEEAPGAGAEVLPSLTPSYASSADLYTDKGVCAADAALTNLDLNDALAPILGYPAERAARTIEQDDAIRAHKNAVFRRTCPERAE